MYYRIVYRADSIKSDSQAHHIVLCFGEKLELTPDAIGLLMKVVDQNIRSFTRTYGAKVIASADQSANEIPLDAFATV